MSLSKNLHFALHYSDHANRALLVLLAQRVVLDQVGLQVQKETMDKTVKEETRERLDLRVTLVQMDNQYVPV